MKRKHGDDDVIGDDALNKSEEVLFAPTEEIEGEESTQEKIAELRTKLAECTKVRDENLLGWQRMKADFVNASREAEEERTRASKRAQEVVLTDLLPVLDSFDMAFGNKAVWESVDKNWRTGIEYIQSQLLAVLKMYNVEPTGTVGESFDPVKHHSIEKVDTNQEELENQISQVLQRGYLMSGKVLRPARVKVFNYKS